jgi:hypothetical protein
MAAVLQSLEEAGLKDSVTHVEVTPGMAGCLPAPHASAVHAVCSEVLGH